MKKTIALETILFSMMLFSTLVIFTSMVTGDIAVFSLGFVTFLFSAIALIITLKK